MSAIVKKAALLVEGHKWGTTLLYLELLKCASATTLHAALSLVFAWSSICTRGL